MIIRDNQPTDNMREYGIISEITWVGFTGTTLDLIWFTNRQHYGITIDQQPTNLPIWNPWDFHWCNQPTWDILSFRHNGDVTDGVLRGFGCLVWPSPNDWLVILELNLSWHSNKVKVITQVGDLTETSNQFSSILQVPVGQCFFLA